MTLIDLIFIVIGLILLVIFVIKLVSSFLNDRVSDKMYKKYNLLYYEFLQKEFIENTRSQKFNFREWSRINYSLEKNGWNYRGYLLACNHDEEIRKLLEEEKYIKNELKRTEKEMFTKKYMG